jgi:hypothetical protein
MHACEAMRLQLLLQQPEVLPPLLLAFALHGDAPQPRRWPWTVREEVAITVGCRLRHRPQLEVTQREGLWMGGRMHVEGMNGEGVKGWVECRMDGWLSCR